MARALEILRREQRPIKEMADRGATAGRHAGQVFVGQQALRERRKNDGADALGFERIQQTIILDPAIDHRITRLMDQTGRPELLEDRCGLLGATRIVGGNADIKRLALANRVIERAHGLFEWGLGIETVRVEDVDVVDAYSLEALVEAGKQRFTAAPFAVRARPHEIARLGRDHELVANASEVAAQDVPEGKFGRAWWGPIIVGEVEMRDAKIERLTAYGAHRIGGLVETEIVPQTQRYRRKFQPAAAAAVVDHFVVARGRRRGGHKCPWS